MDVIRPAPRPLHRAQRSVLLWLGAAALALMLGLVGNCVRPAYALSASGSQGAEASP